MGGNVRRYHHTESSHSHYFNKAGGGFDREISIKPHLFCPCGYDGSVTETEECPSCGRKTEIKLFNWKEQYRFKKGSSNVCEQDGKVIYEGVVTVYDYDVKRDDYPFLIISDLLLRFVLDVKTGVTLLSLEGVEVDMTYGGSVSGQPSDFHIPLHIVKEDKEQIQKFIQWGLEKRGGCYIAPSLFDDFEGLVNMCIYFRYPQLQNIPYQNFGFIPPEMRERLDKIRKGEELFYFFTGLKEKSVRKAYNFPNSFYLLNILKKFIHEPSDITYFSKQFLVESYIRECLFYKEHKIHFGNNRVVRDIKSLAAFYSSEKVFFNRVLKALRNEEQKSVSFSDFEQYIRDINRMHTSLNGEIPNYSFPYHRDIRKTHDILSKDFTRFEEEKSKNKVLNYTQTEKELEGFFQNYWFELFKDTNSLIEAGSILHICIASYRGYALKKESTLLSIKDENHNYVACIELKNNSIRQVRMRRNAAPSKLLNDTVIEWAKKNLLMYESCSDLTA